MTKKILCAFVVIAAAMITSAKVFSIGPNLALFRRERDIKAPVDYGSGPGRGIGFARPNLVLGRTPPIPKAAAKAALPIPTGGDHYQGYFAPPVPWPIIPIHMALLPDGRVMTYGTDQSGAQGAQFVYDIWDPKLGTGANAHTVLPNTTPGQTDIFCSAGSLLGSGFIDGTNGSGQLLIAGGDLTVGGVRNYSSNNVTIFNPKNNTLAASGKMNYARWYASMITLRNGDKLVLGGQLSPGVAEPTPEVYNAASGWRTLPGISMNSGNFEWVYPRGFVGFDGAVYLLQHDGGIFRLTTDGAGTMTDTGARLAPGFFYYPTVMYAPFKVLSVRSNQIVQDVDLSTNPPVVTNLPNISKDRLWANGTLLADGGVLVTGGSGVYNQFTDVDYQAVYLDPGPGGALASASASIPRLYHSATLLLPDGSVLTGGGGAPGPVNELNAEIYYPYYLYLNDGSGSPAPRPTIVSAPPSTAKLGQQFSMTVGSNDQISYINLIRMGMTTHSFNSDQRGTFLSFVQNGATITVSLANSPETTPPGYYMLFVFNTAFVPAMAPIISVLQAVN
ncbi:MAG: galactose oxidase-like domain-containing protein [Methylocella sp.]